MKNLISMPALILAAAAVLGCGLGGDAPPRGETNRAAEKPAEVAEKKAPEAETPVRSTVLVEAFKKDPSAANAKYKDKVILISGKITNINDVFGSKALNLRDSENVLGLQTYLADAAEVGRVKVGDEVVVRGKVRGDGTDVIDSAVIIKVN
jgi:hypothetical protein